MNKVLQEVLQEIIPTEQQEEKVKKLAAEVLEVTNKEVSKYKAVGLIAGSLTRNTWLVSKNEFDLFIIFPENFSEDKLEKLG